MDVIAIIPARGGSKGIPRKNLRPLAGKPMIYYSIKATIKAKIVNKVVVTTDDEEIALFASRFGAEVIMRPEELGGDAITLDPVIAQAVIEAERLWDRKYDIVLTIQPTSPLIRSSDIEEAMKKFIDPRIDTALSVVDDRHLCWTVKDGRPVPTYRQRMNRQQLPLNYKESGAIIACRREQLEKGARIGENIAIFEMEQARSFDIDTLSDFYLCECVLNYKRIVFAVVGRKNLGLGHAYRAVMLAHELVKYDIQFVCEAQDDLAIEYISSRNYQVHTTPNGSLLEAVLSLNPDMVINDILDTDAPYIQALKDNNILIVNFEDLGEGREKANLVINALYPKKVASKHVLEGYRYFCLRDEFLYAPLASQRNNGIKRILITYGGVDESNLTLRVLNLIAPHCIASEIEIDIVAGPGYLHTDNLWRVIEQIDSKKINFVPSTPRISDYMASADLAITSGGRTVYELAAMGVPTLVICQNQRELMHSFASHENGIINVGYAGDVSDDNILQTFNKLLSDEQLISYMRERIGSLDLTNGKKRVVSKICALFEEG